jgi:UDP-GlcNAc:undecaprenyl-phosphate/decaprenyl-phosphate GlcNAc-1-phosphate transferase
MVAATLVALPVAALVVWLSLRSPLRRIVASPSAERWHVQATPSLGGIGIFAGILAGAGAAVAAGAVDLTSELVGILAACTVLFATGLVDDIRGGMRPLVKIAAQLAAVAIVLASGVQVEAINNEILATVIAVLWLVGMTNAVNFLDNMDGVAASVTAIAAGFFALDAATAHENRLVLVLALAVVLACLGFLPFNIRPGRGAAVFMGDSGSMVLGFALGSIALLSSWKAAGASMATILLPVLVLAVPILDALLVTVVRALEGRPVYAGGVDHTSHRLVYSGLSEKHAVVLLSALAAAVGGTSLLYAAVDDVRVTLLGVLVTFALLVQFAGALAAVDESEEGGLRVSFRRALEGQWGRRLAEVLGDFVLISGAFAVSYLLRFEGVGTPESRELFGEALAVVLAARYAFFLLFGLYSGVWRYAGIRDAVRIVSAIVLSEAVAVALLAISDETTFATFSRSVFVIDVIVCTLVIGASRFGPRAIARLFPRPAEQRERSTTLAVGDGRVNRRQG